jgi:hypothetical protein
MNLKPHYERQHLPNIFWLPCQSVSVVKVSVSIFKVLLAKLGSAILSCDSRTHAKHRSSLSSTMTMADKVENSSIFKWDGSLDKSSMNIVPL